MSKQESDKPDLQQIAKSRTSIGQILSEHQGEQHLIVLHDFPDPDAIAAAYAHKLISAAFDIKTDIIYGGRISHTQNIALVQLLAIELMKYEGNLPGQYDAAVFVDNQGTTCAEIAAALEDADVKPLIVVDHHEPQSRLQPVFSDIRAVGATATIYAEYLTQDLISMNNSNKDHVTAATALMHGLISDTGNFIRAHAEDFQAAAFLSQFVDTELLTQITRQGRSKQVMETIHRSLDNRIVVESFSIAGIGYLRAEDRDAIPQAADFLLTEANVHTAIIYGIVSTSDQIESLVGSMRTSKITINPDTFIKEVFGKDANGRFYGGGKASAAGFEIPVGFLSGAHNETYQNLKWEVYDSQVKHKIFTKIGIETKPETTKGSS